ncbi:DUF1214 containing protein, putative [Babesia ovata]|uniref:DUF1214 containing protein, putative n=1 Tax=Babesia ovata TaxID=189622 RepID=A0A2H6KAT4_9APIC|nr:DUF1214 containing protein, putative [Babesia ovata]GBE60069.1 DUF1214 containing protein, putative [Babesia ovata]
MLYFGFRSIIFVLLAAYIGALSVFGDAKSLSASQPNIKTQSHCPKDAECAYTGGRVGNHIHLGTFNNKRDNEPLVIKVRRSKLYEPMVYAVTALSKISTGNQWMCVGILNSKELRRVKQGYPEYYNKILTEEYMEKVTMLGQHAHEIHVNPFMVLNAIDTEDELPVRDAFAPLDIGSIEAPSRNSVELPDHDGIELPDRDTVEFFDSDDTDAQSDTTLSGDFSVGDEELDGLSDTTPGDADESEITPYNVDVLENDEVNAQSKTTPDDADVPENNEVVIPSKTTPVDAVIPEGDKAVTPSKTPSVGEPEISKATLSITPTVREGKYYVVFAYGSPFRGPKMVCFKEVIVKVLP